MSEQDKPWGAESLIFTTDVNVRGKYDTLAVRKIEIDGEEMTAYKQHEGVNKVLYINQGMAEIRQEDDVIEVNEDNAYYIESGSPYQIQNITGQVLEIIEVCFPFDSKDQQVIEDPYE